MKHLFSVENKIVVITGGTGVLGSVMAKGLAEAGAHVIIIGRRVEAGAKVTGEIQQAGGKASFFQADVLNREELQQVKEKILSTAGTIDILINGAGGNMAGATIPPDKTFFDLDTKGISTGC